MPTEHICSECGAKISPDAQGGLCVRCLFNLGLKSEAGTEDAAPLPPITEKPGDWIGHYKLLQKIGEGGCGVVYMAEQEEPVRRRVALKVIKLGMDTQEVIARFEAERQALAMMDHPNIAKIFDAGVSGVSQSEIGNRKSEIPQGRPYFVMELVRGVKITDYCDQHNLPTRERLDLFIKVCQAIQHAHQKGIIHRDIKPSNILVTVNDGVPVPKVIDFGIAKAIEGRLTDKTLFTAFQQFLGTPAYMSPEQAEMTSLDIDTRSDIYSLGVLLYELLTGKTPFDARELREAGIDAMRHTIREQEPAKPSTCLSTMAGDDLTAVAKQRQADPPKLISLVRGDLDWIVMKCLEKDRTRRYDTANAFALDIRRYLAHEPVTAAAPSVGYRFGKFTRRNKVALGVAATISAVLAAAAVASNMAISHSAAGHRDEAVKLREEVLALSDIVKGPEHPDTISAMAKLADSYHEAGRRDEALDLREKVLSLRRKVFGLEHPDTILAMSKLAQSYSAAGRRPEALKLLEEALSLSRKTNGPQHQVTLSAMSMLATFYADSGRKDEALKLREELLLVSRKGLGAEHPETVTAMHNLANSYFATGRNAEAEALRRELAGLKATAEKQKLVTTTKLPPSTVKPYAVSLSLDYAILPIISVGDRVPLTGDSSKEFQMIGVPDGLGAYNADGGKVVLYMNHEVAGTGISEPVIGSPRWRGAFVSKFVLNADAEVLSGECAYNLIVDPAGNVLPPAQVGNTTPGFVRFCSGTLAWLDAGFDRPIYLCGEENPAPATFDGKGGLAVAIFDQVLYTLPQLGHFQHGNAPVRPHPTPETVLMLMEDDVAYHAQLYMYVGQKDFTPGAHPLARNGLTGGKMYVLAATAPGLATEANFQTGSIAGHWVEIAGVAGMTEAQLDAAAVAVGAFGFAKSEDGAWSKHDKNEFFFNSTGDTLNSTAPGNHLGRTYRLNLNADDVTGPCTLTILYNADQKLAAGGDIAINPDNIDVGKDYCMISEDGTGFGRTVMANKGRDGRIWRYDLKNNYAATPVVSLNPPGRGATPARVGPGVWETSGIIDAEHFYGRNSWLFTVQAHPPTAAPAPNTIEDGQLLLLLPLK